MGTSGLNPVAVTVGVVGESKEKLMNDLNKKLAEWVGFNFGKDFPDIYSTHGYGSDPTGVMISGLPNFTESLDTCFKWLLPKSRVEAIKLMPTTSGGYGCSLIPEGWGSSVSALAETPALALCKAIQKLTDGAK